MRGFTIRGWDKQRGEILRDRYALPGEDSVVNVWMRAAKLVANGSESRYQRYMKALSGFGFVPGGRILSGCGNGRSTTLYNCFVIGVRPEVGTSGNDSRQSIMNTVGRMIEITARGGGVGINWSTLRPSGAEVKGVGSYSSGPVCWMRGADSMVDQVRQGGTRTGALMYMLDDWHPDVIGLSNLTERFQRANFSVSMSDAFMHALDRGSWELKFPDTNDVAYDSMWDGNINAWGGGISYSEDIDPKIIMEQMAGSAHRIGSPGVVFLDRCNKMSNTRGQERLIATNPCGEQPLPENGCCNLGSINLVSFWDEKQGDIDLVGLEDCVRSAVRFLDGVIDVSPVIDNMIHSTQVLSRRVGLGTMGLADLLLLIGARYGGPRSLMIIDKVYSVIRDAAYSESARMAGEKTPSYMYWDDEFSRTEFYQTLSRGVKREISEFGIRNMSLLTQAPTGTTSILAGVSSGIEPIWGREYVRTDATGKHAVKHPLLQGDEDYMVTAMDVSAVEHVRIQAEVQKHVDTSVSKTVNLDNRATVGDIIAIYKMAYELGCKGITIYRSGSLEGDVMTQEAPVVCERCAL
jgi:ribonucleoside-diphosphate reductase alpha chain